MHQRCRTRAEFGLVFLEIRHNESQLHLQMTFLVFCIICVTKQPSLWSGKGNKFNFKVGLKLHYMFFSGRRFAEQEMYVVIIKILQNFQLEWKFADLSQKFQILMVPDAPVHVTFKDR